jgi:hypothetical protein
MQGVPSASNKPVILDPYKSLPGKKLNRITLTSTAPFTPNYVTSLLRQPNAQTKNGIYASRIQGRQILLENPARESKAKLAREQRRQKRKEEQERKQLGVIGKREALQKGVWTFDQRQAKCAVHCISTSQSGMLTFVALGLNSSSHCTIFGLVTCQSCSRYLLHLCRSQPHLPIRPTLLLCMQSWLRRTTMAHSLLVRSDHASCITYAAKLKNKLSHQRQKYIACGAFRDRDPRERKCIPCSHSHG